MPAKIKKESPVLISFYLFHNIANAKAKISRLFYRPYFKLSIFLLFIVFIAGCVTPQPIGGGLFVTMKADPQAVFSSGTIRLNVDLDNQNPRSIRDIDALVFDPGIMTIIEGTGMQGVSEGSSEIVGQLSTIGQVLQQGDILHGDIEYTVKQGDTLWNIVKRYYGLSDYKEIAAKVNEVVDYNVGRIPHLSIDNVRFNVADDPSTYERCPSEPCDYIRGDVIYPGDVLILPRASTSGKTTKERYTGVVCGKHINEMRPNQFETFSCMLRAPGRDELPQSATQNNIHAKIEYTTDLAVGQVIELMTEPEYLRRVSTGEFRQKSKSYSYKDKNVQIDVEFSDNLPIIIRANEPKDYFVYITIRNIGNGFIREITRNDFNIVQARAEGIRLDDIVHCPALTPDWKIEPVGKDFPRIACTLRLPQGVTVVENYGMLVMLNYRYEVREKATVTVIR